MALSFLPSFYPDYEGVTLDLLPRDVWRNVVERLDIETLARCKCVNRKWRRWVRELDPKSKHLCLQKVVRRALNWVQHHERRGIDVRHVSWRVMLRGNRFSNTGFIILYNRCPGLDVSMACPLSAIKALAPRETRTVTVRDSSKTIYTAWWQTLYPHVPAQYISSELPVFARPSDVTDKGSVGRVRKRYERDSECLRQEMRCMFEALGLTA